MDGIGDLRKERGDTFVHLGLEKGDGHLGGEFKTKLFGDLEESSILLALDVGNLGLHHEVEEVEKEVRLAAEDVVRLAAELDETLVFAALCTSHRDDHFFAQLHRRRESLWIVAEDEPKVDVKEVSARRDQQIVEMAISNAENVRDDAVSGWEERSAMIENERTNE